MDIVLNITFFFKYMCISIMHNLNALIFIFNIISHKFGYGFLIFIGCSNYI